MKNKLVEITFILFRNVIGHLGRYLSVYKIDLSIGPCAFLSIWSDGPALFVNTARPLPPKTVFYEYKCTCIKKKVETAQYFVETAQYDFRQVGRQFFFMHNLRRKNETAAYY